MTASKIVAAAASGVGGAGLDVDEVFSTQVYETASSVAVNNGIDLSGEGGLVWIKTRDIGDNHFLNDTARGTGKALSSDLASAESTTAYKTVSSFNSNGYTAQGHGYASSRALVSWTFRKAPKFFDIVTYTGNGANRTIAHNLGSVPGMIIVKCVSHAPSDWLVYHRSGHFSAPEDYGFLLNGTYPRQDSSGYWNDTAPTSSVFSVGTNGNVNTNGNSYVAYIFAHNNNDGEFGPDSDQDIIKCGKFEGLAATQNINIGFEPQWVLLKQSSAGTSSNWIIIDAMRGIVTGENDTELRANTTDAEVTSSNYLELTATGFTIPSNSPFNTYGPECIYMAIRRGPLAAPDDATDVFSIDTLGTSAPYFDSNHIVDMGLVKQTGAASSWFVYTRLAGEKNFYTDFTAAENNASEAGFDFMNGHIDSNWGGTNSYSWMWKRAPSYFDVVGFSGTGSARTVSHNLGAVPEMMWVKRRSTTGEWAVYHSGVDASAPENYYLSLNATNARDTGTTVWNDTAPTSDVFSLGTIGWVNASGHDYIAYLFATVAGVSKVGSYTGNGAAQNIDCGFSSGARFVLIKKTTGSSDMNWWLFDTERGLVSGDDARLFLNTTDAEYSADYVDPYSGGFAVTSFLSESGVTYIFYAIA